VPINVEEGSRVTISFTKVDLVVRDERSDYIEVFDGLDELHGTSLAVITGDETLPPPIVSSGETMFIKFVSTGADDQTARGFELDYSVSKCEDDCSNNGYCFDNKCHCRTGFFGAKCADTECGDCGGETKGKCQVSLEGQKCECVPGYYGGECTDKMCSGVTKFTQSKGNFSDHHATGVQDYITNNECQWIIYAPSPSAQPKQKEAVVSIIQLHFNRFDLEENKDFIHIYESETPDVTHLLRSFSGDVIPVDVVSSTGVMLVTFETNVGAKNEGFDCSFTTYQRTVNVEPTTAPHESKTAAALFTFVTFCVGGVLGALFAYFYRPLRQRGREGEEEEEEPQQGGEGGFSLMGQDNGESLLDSD